MTGSYRHGRQIQPAPTHGATLTQAGSPLLRTVLAVLAVLVLVFSAIGYFSVGKVGSQIAGAGGLELGDDSGLKKAKDGATDILLVGSDSRTDAQGNPLNDEEIALLHAGDEENNNTDTMMVIRVPNDGSSATAISIPRDTYIHEPEIGNIKINGVYLYYMQQAREKLMAQGVTNERTLFQASAEAGRRGLISAISDLTGITVDHYAEIGLLGFALFTDAVGGVDVCLLEDTYDEFSGANFTAGVHTLSGGEALSFVRQRHGLQRGDLDRIVRQQAYAASLVQKVLSSDVLTNPTKLTDLAAAAKRSVIIDDGWDIMSMATQLQNLVGGNVRFDTIPVTSIDGVGDYGESVVTVDTVEVHKFFAATLGDKDHPGPTSQIPVPSDLPTTTFPTINTVYVYNASSIDGRGGSIGDYLTARGLTVGEVANAEPGLYQNSQLIVSPTTGTSDPDSQALAAELGNLPITVSDTLIPGEVVVIVHTDYAGPEATPTGTGTDPAEMSSMDMPNVVGQEGMAIEGQLTPTITAGGEGPRCVY
ncbi:MAG: LCP family protein [Corynebacterium sp.]|nr:LCP family protein [Corynebacterium sp.]